MSNDILLLELITTYDGSMQCRQRSEVKLAVDDSLLRAAHSLGQCVLAAILIWARRKAGVIRSLQIRTAGARTILHAQSRLQKSARYYYAG